MWFLRGKQELARERKVKKGLQQEVHQVQRHKGMREAGFYHLDGETEAHGRKDTSPRDHTANGWAELRLGVWSPSPVRSPQHQWLVFDNFQIYYFIWFTNKTVISQRWEKGGLENSRKLPKTSSQWQGWGFKPSVFNSQASLLSLILCSKYYCFKTNLVQRKTLHTGVNRWLDK